MQQICQSLRTFQWMGLDYALYGADSEEDSQDGQDQGQRWRLYQSVERLKWEECKRLDREVLSSSRRWYQILWMEFRRLKRWKFRNSCFFLCLREASLLDKFLNGKLGTLNNLHNYDCVCFKINIEIIFTQWNRWLLNSCSIQLFINRVILKWKVLNIYKSIQVPQIQCNCTVACVLSQWLFQWKWKFKHYSEFRFSKVVNDVLESKRSFSHNGLCYLKLIRFS